MPDVNIHEMTTLLSEIRKIIRMVGDSTTSQSNTAFDQQYYDENIKERLTAFITTTIDNKAKTELLNQQVESLKRDLTSLKTTTNALATLDNKQQGSLKLILRANKAKIDAQTAQNEASQFAQIAQTEANEARIVAPDALSLQTIMSRAADVRQASEKAASSANQAVTAADKATQSVASVEESNALANLPAEEVEQSEDISTVNSGETSATGELPESPEELVGVARNYAYEAMKFKDEAQKITSEVKDLASKITQEYDNWSVVQNLFSIAK